MKNTRDMITAVKSDQIFGSYQHSNPEKLPVDPGEELEGVVGGGPRDPDRLLECERDEAGEEEGAEGVHVEGD